jgi:DNA polymerase (family 10)
MKTEEILKALKLSSRLMELHNDNPFKIKSLNNAVFKLEKTGIDLSLAAQDELEKTEGIGKGIAQKIMELQSTGDLKELNHLVGITPAGVIDMLGIKGLGPKKVAQLWKELNLESTGELLYACSENRLTTLKGFGAKTQEAVKRAIEFKNTSSGKFHYSEVEGYALELLDKLKVKHPGSLISLTGPIRRKCEILEQIDILIATKEKVELPVIPHAPSIAVKILTCFEQDFFSSLFATTASGEHIRLSGFKPNQLRSEEKIYFSLGLQYIEPELREGLNEVLLAKENKLPRLIEASDLKGILHNHTTFSDGLHSLREMAEHCRDLGYEYLGICDHSQSAFYANGMKPEQVIQQQQEIDDLNKHLSPFRIFKGIESDILNDGSLDYKEEILRSFDFVVASIHSNLKMNLEKATERLIKAVENPYTSILGHPTGRLLLSREGYPIDHKKVIDACAANNVVMELNAHPFRLDIDWRWIRYCLDKGVKISINPDAHSMQGFDNMYYGICVARKAMLTKEMCFNAMSCAQVEDHFNHKKRT